MTSLFKSIRWRAATHGRWIGGFFLGALLCATGCAPHIRMKPEFHLARIHRLGMTPFNGEGGSAATAEFVRQLNEQHVELSRGSSPADALLTGTVTDYRPAQKLMIFLGNTSLPGSNGALIRVSNPIVSLNGSQLNGQGAVFGSEHLQMVSVSASVGIQARLIDPFSGNVVWNNEFVYEGLDVDTSMQTVVRYLSGSLMALLPDLPKKRGIPPSLIPTVKTRLP